MELSMGYSLLLATAFGFFLGVLWKFSVFTAKYRGRNSINTNSVDELEKWVKKMRIEKAENK